MRLRAIAIEGDADAATIALIRAAIEQSPRRVDLFVQAAPLRPGERLPDQPPIPADPREVVASVAFETGLSAAAITSERRDAPLVRARDAVIWAGREVLNVSNTRLGRLLGFRDHSTVVAAARRADRRLATDPAFRLLCDRLRARFEREAA